MAPFFKEITGFFDLGTVEKLSPGDEHVMCKGKKDKPCVVAGIESDDLAEIRTNAQSALIVGESKEWFRFTPETKVEISKENPYKLSKKSAKVEGVKGKSNLIIWHR